MDELTLFRDIIENTRPIVAKVDAGDNGTPTPCADWTVLDLLQHTIGGLFGAADSVTGGPPSAPADLAARVGVDPAAAYGDAAAVCLEAFSVPGALDQVYQVPPGEMPGSQWILYPAFDVYAHGWDLARSIGVDASFPDDLTAPVLAYLRPRYDMPNRPVDKIGVPRAIAEDAPLIDQLVAYLGRRPDWAAAG